MKRRTKAIGVAILALAGAAGISLGGAGTAAVLPSSAQVPDADAGLGMFQGHGDVGTVLHPGSVEHDAAKRTYTVAGSGENMWATKDAFHFAWKKASGDLSLAADIAFLGRGKDPHRKACLMIRQDLSADSAYVDVALHGDGLTSLQFRPAKGAATHEVQANVSAPRRLRIEKRGRVRDHVPGRRRPGAELLGGGGEDRAGGAVLRRARGLRARSRTRPSAPSSRTWS